MCVGWTNVDIDDEVCRVVMDRYHLAAKREAVNLALRLLAREPLTVEVARATRGSRWDGDLAARRAGRTWQSASTRQSGLRSVATLSVLHVDLQREGPTVRKPHGGD
jgi:Arc/MetJ family transcription regulator